MRRSTKPGKVDTSTTTGRLLAEVFVRFSGLPDLEDEVGGFSDAENEGVNCETWVRSSTSEVCGVLLPRGIREGGSISGPSTASRARI